MSETVRVNVAAFGSAVDALGWTERVFELAAPATLAHLVARLERDCPRLAEARGRVRYAVNEVYAAAETPLRPGDEVAVIPPVSGGDVDEPPQRIAARLTRTPIDGDALCAEVSAAGCGAIASFLGIVRSEQREGDDLVALEYQAHEAMARGEMQRIAEEQGRRHDVFAVRVVHRLGRLSIGEASVAVVVSSPHRAAAFAACREIMEQIKQRAPIFKREVWRGAEPTWVDPIA